MVSWHGIKHAGVRSVPRSGDFGAEETKRCSCQRNCGGTESIGTEEGVVGSTSAFTMVAGANDRALYTVEAEVGAIDYSAAALLSAACLSGSSGTEARLVGFPFVPFSELAHVRSLAHIVLDSPATSEVDCLGAVSTDGG